MGDIVRCALISLSRKRLRTALTVGSITIGVMLVVIVTMISNAGKKVVNAELESLGLSGLSICTNSTLNSGGQMGITPESLEVIRNTKSVVTAMPLIVQFAGSLLKDTQSDTLICGIDAGAVQAISLTLKYGRMISRGDVRAVDYVCVVDETLAKQAYGRENITGKTINLQVFGVEYEFEIIGVAKAGSSLLQNLGEIIPGMVYVPYSTLQTLTGRTNFDQIAVRVSSSADIVETESQIIRRLERLTGYKDYFRADNLSLQRDRLGGLLDIVSLVLTVISGISLVVSGLGIMTIMLVSVNERMREIGIKIYRGDKQADYVGIPDRSGCHLAHRKHCRTINRRDNFIYRNQHLRYNRAYTFIRYCFINRIFIIDWRCFRSISRIESFRAKTG